MDEIYDDLLETMDAIAEEKSNAVKFDLITESLREIILRLSVIDCKQ